MTPIRASTVASGFARLLSIPIHLYRWMLSPFFPPACRFYPSCSRYALDALHTHGPLRGVGLTLWRILRCNPFNPGGVDPVPTPSR